MSQLAVIIPEDEFGGLEWIGLPGQDPEMIRTMLETLTKEVEPKNVIERCWMRDIAILTVRMNFMRRAHWMIMAAIMEEIATAEAKAQEPQDGGPNEVEEDLLALVRRMASGDSVPEASRDLRIMRLLGKALRQNLPLSQTLMQMEMGIARERDRLLNLYDSRRGMQIAEAAQMLELAGLFGARAAVADLAGYDESVASAASTEDAQCAPGGSGGSPSTEGAA